MTEPTQAPKSYLVVGSKPWNRRAFDTQLCRLPGHWSYAGSQPEFSPELVHALAPRYIFVLHWSWKVPAEIYERFECVCFHMTDVPYGRGGSPLQNLILRGHRETRLTALRMAQDFDAGPVYLKELLSLEGNAEEIYIRATSLAAQMIERMVREEPVPKPQEGEVVNFKRRRPEESAIPMPETLSDMHDFIRMLDAEDYPHAYLEYAGFRFEFSRAALYDGHVAADVKITRTPKEPKK